jgi:hypothetical protein
MSSEHVSDENHAQSGEPFTPVTESGHSQRLDGKGPGWRTLAPIIAAVTVAGVIASLLFFTRDSTPTPDRSAPQQGLACPHLRQAAQAFDDGDISAFDDDVATAASAAQHALQTSGETFGEPEHIALELHLKADDNPARVQRLLGAALRACEGIS